MKPTCNLLALAVLLSAPAAFAQDIALDRARLQGTWEPIEARFDGAAPSKDLLKELQWAIDGDQVSELLRGRRQARATLTLDASKRPALLDLAYTEGPGKGLVVRGICKLEGDTLTVCLALSGPRPSDFASRPGGGVSLIAFKRVK